MSSVLTEEAKYNLYVSLSPGMNSLFASLFSVQGNAFHHSFISWGAIQCWEQTRSDGLVPFYSRSRKALHWILMAQASKYVPPNTSLTMRKSHRHWGVPLFINKYGLNDCMGSWGLKCSVAIQTMASQTTHILFNLWKQRGNQILHVRRS